MIVSVPLPDIDEKVTEKPMTFIRPPLQADKKNQEENREDQENRGGFQRRNDNQENHGAYPRQNPREKLEILKPVASEIKEKPAQVQHDTTWKKHLPITYEIDELDAITELPSKNF